MPTESKGFTLIELLIVVAIIAVLAAIAVPNFLEAQMRSKVSRSMADMRTLATALESYASDRGYYPDRANAGWDNNLAWLCPLTTPVAYVTSVPKFPWKPWNYPWNPGMIIDFYDYNDRVSWTRGYEMYGGTQWWVFDPQNNHKWWLAATGPDAILNIDVWVDAPGSCHLPYDPTNGSVSDGDIIRLGP